MRACRRASLALAFLRLADPFTLRDRDRESRRSRASKALWAFGPAIVSPVLSVARAEMPRSTPTVPWFSALGGCASTWASTVMLTNQRSATRESVADMILPAKRNDSRMRTHPRLGMRMREPSTVN